MALRATRTMMIIAASSALMLGGCETLQSINPFGGSSKKAEQAKEEKFDDRPLTKDTGNIPPDISNRNYTEEELRAE